MVVQKVITGLLVMAAVACNAPHDDISVVHANKLSRTKAKKGLGAMPGWHGIRKMMFPLNFYGGSPVSGSGIRARNVDVSVTNEQHSAASTSSSSTSNVSHPHSSPDEVISTNERLEAAT